jgi:hypothetical protein
MAIYMIGYDLHQGEDYEPLISAIKSLSGTWWHHLDSTWLIVHNGGSDMIRDTLIPYLPRKGDKLFVAIMGSNDAAWIGFREKASDWLYSHLA